MPSTPHSSKFAKLFSLVGPGILVAATGVGAGDLATAGFAGSQLGIAVLWAILVGAFFKFGLTEGLMRWQLATGKTLLEGVARHLGPIPGWLFLVYFILWSYFVGSALISANGVALLALVPVFDNPMTGKIVLGSAASILGLILARKGGFKLFEKVMGVCILIMFVTVAISAVIVAPSLSELATGLAMPSRIGPVISESPR
ncbi:MAG: Nramp family divalent metal transporter [Opitutales bacterium]|nr:Nramp family divalent metal transporter [Opitutales bacterium]